MPTLNFPSNPTLNQVYSFGGKTWIWNGLGWQLQAQGSINGIVIGNVTPASGGFTTISATGNVSGNYFIGNGSQLTGIVAEAGAAIVYGNSNVSIGGANANVTVGVAGSANVAVFAPNQVNFTANLIPVANAVYSLGNSTLQWKDLWVSNATIYLGNVPINMGAGNVLQVAGDPVLTNDGTEPITTTGNISAGYFIGNGSQLTGMASALTVSQYTTGNVSNVITDVSALRFDTVTGFNVTDLGNSEALISLGSTFKTWEVAGQANLVAVGEDVVEFVAGNGIVITTNANSIPQQIAFAATYANSNVAGLLSDFGSNVISTTGNITAGNFVGNGAVLTSVMADRGTDSNNWNALTQMGVYTVNRASWAGTVGTPLDSQVFVGLLEVKNSTNTAIEQMFFPGTVESGNVKIQWNRAYWSGAWTDWVKIVNDFQVVTGGEF